MCNIIVSIIIILILQYVTVAMSVVGFDIGSESAVIAIARNNGIDIILNEASSRSTP